MWISTYEQALRVVISSETVLEQSCFRQPITGDQSRSHQNAGGVEAREMVAFALHLNGAWDYSEGLTLGPWMHPELWVNCLSAAVCVINACHTRGLKNNPVANSISQNNCLRSALLGCVATKITLPTGGDGFSMCMHGL